MLDTELETGVPKLQRCVFDSTPGGKNSKLLTIKKINHHETYRT
jgi:hypothetical protein